MVKKNIWVGSYYSRGPPNNRTWRQRGTGHTVVYERKGSKRNVKWVGLEKPKANFYGQDFKPNVRQRRIWATRVKSNRIGSKKSRSSHRRVYGQK